MIHLTPVIKDLELEKFGLEYIDCDPFAFAPLPNGEGAIYFWKDVDKTCESIAKISPEDADRYKKFVTEWEKLNEGVFKAFLKPPTVMNLGRHMIFGTKSKNPADMVRKLMTSYGALGQTDFQTRRLTRGDGVARGAIGTAADGDGERRFSRLAFDDSQKRRQTSKRRKRRIDASDGAMSGTSRRRDFIKRGSRQNRS